MKRSSKFVLKYIYIIFVIYEYELNVNCINVTNKYIRFIVVCTEL